MDGPRAPAKDDFYSRYMIITEKLIGLFSTEDERRAYFKQCFASLFILFFFFLKMETNVIYNSIYDI